MFLESENPRNMCSIEFSSVIFSLIISITHAIASENSPIIVVTQGVIENEDLLPITVFWYHPKHTENDWLFVNSSVSRIRFEAHHRIDSSSGFYELPHTALERGGSPGNYCVLIKSREAFLNRNPSCESKVEWMYDRRDVLGNFSLQDLVIPGTHHSGAYARVDDESRNEQGPISRWTLTQTKSIKSQLMDGIRYLDLRPSAIFDYGVKKFLVTHSIFALVSMDAVVKQVNEFMDISRDVVILSFKEFYKGFHSDEDHQIFIRYLERSFERHAHQRGVWRYPLRKIWEDDRRLIISYDHHTYNSSDFMWPSIPHYWSDSQTINRLHAFFDETHRSIPYAAEPYAAMVELTHSFATISQDIFQRDLSLRHWAERVGKHIPRWYTEEWNKTANIIAVDFYQTSGIVDLAIQLNEQRCRCSQYKSLK